MSFNGFVCIRLSYTVFSRVFFFLFLSVRIRVFSIRTDIQNAWVFVFFLSRFFRINSFVGESEKSRGFEVYLSNLFSKVKCWINTEQTNFSDFWIASIENQTVSNGDPPYEIHRFILCIICGRHVSRHASIYFMLTSPSPIDGRWVFIWW